MGEEWAMISEELDVRNDYFRSEYVRSDSQGRLRVSEAVRISGM